jgi:hypothetical protein
VNGSHATVEVTPNEGQSELILRQGLGESPGVPSYEYLGIGYNAITGNPRGTESSNIDPGFRASVIKLINDQDVRTVDTVYTVPLGTELRYITSCEYSSQASEISSSSSYQNELRKTVESTVSRTRKESNSRSESSSSSGGGSFLGIGGSSSSSSTENESSELNEDVFFSNSESYRKFVQQEQETEITSFEAQGVCTEFEASLKKYYTHELHDSFTTGLYTLPVPYDKDDESHVTAYSEFISIYGTHFINRVSFGARTVLSTSMSRSSVKDLQRDEIDVASSFSYKKSESRSSSRDSSKSGSRGAFGFSASSSSSISVSNYQSNSISNTQSESETEQSDIENRIAERIQSIKEFNVGGLPAAGGDWKEWARSVKENPMPISYDVRHLLFFNIFLRRDAHAAFNNTNFERIYVTTDNTIMVTH